MKKLNINQMAEDDRPREKLLHHGPQTLSDAELLALLIGSGSTRETAVQLMQRLMDDCNHSLAQLGRMTVEELTAGNYHGLGPAKAAVILAACELGRRRQAEERTQRRIGSAADICDLLRENLQDCSREEAWIILLNHNYGFMKKVRLSQGGLTETAVDVRVALKHALLAGATVLALCHNHPSGSQRPSGADDRITRQMKDACDLMRIYFLDHVIYTDNGFYSYRDENRL